MKSVCQRSGKDAGREKCKEVHKLSRDAARISETQKKKKVHACKEDKRNQDKGKKQSVAYRFPSFVWRESSVGVWRKESVARRIRRIRE